VDVVIVIVKYTHLWLLCMSSGSAFGTWYEWAGSAAICDKLNQAGSLMVEIRSSQHTLMIV